ncbi:CAP domain-containing protein [Streptomyces sp. NPDC058685]|uniref:CAP domain-containing protein n=1 Tax=Streptomyces sp. NPDC058685 TaxID=3346598 RepID=UPI003657B3F9
MGRHRRSAKRAGRPVRTGLLGVSAAVAVGAVIVASGLLPGDDTSVVGGEGSPAKQVRSEGSARLQTQGDASAEPTPEASSPAASSSSSSPTAPAATPPRAKAPAKSPAQKPAKPVKPAKRAEPTKPAKPKAERSTKAPAPKPAKPAPEKSKKEKKESAPTRTESRSPDRAPDRQKPVSSSSEAAAEAEVLNLVNEERSKVGCSPVRTDAPLAKLAGTFSKDMADRGFFGHTDPDGDSPWARAAQSGVNRLGAENIARGQADASAVMNSWMNSEGHRANILNCDYKTLGVGVHMADGGPWWTQDFGF